MLRRYGMGLLLLGFTLAANAVEVHCLLAPNFSKSSVILSSNIGTDSTAVAKNKAMTSRSLWVRHDNDGAETLFSTYALEQGDCILLNRDEHMTLSLFDDVRDRQRLGESMSLFLKRWAQEYSRIANSPAVGDYFPVVLFRKLTGEKLFALIEERLVDDVLDSVAAPAETATQAIVDYPVDPALTVLYLICPRDRMATCRLQIKTQGHWVLRADGQRFELPALARSVRQSNDSGKSYRLMVNGDTPQGIYTLWASMFTESDDFGKVPRIDLDSAFPPINGDAFETQRFLLSKLIPRAAFHDYWVNELALAHAMGRVFLRIHASSTGSGPAIPPTHGCVSLGNQMKTLLDKLVQLGVFRADDLNGNGALKGWKVTPEIGTAFLIVKDE